MDALPWNLIGDALKAGRYNLLLGAGISLDSDSGFIGKKCPSTSELIGELKISLPNVREGSPLSRYYRAMTPDQVEELITKRFRGCSPGDTVKAIAGFRWKRIFTLNIDDALEVEYERLPVPVQLHKTINYNEPYESIRDLRILPIIHLHGWSQRPDDKYIFDIKSYMSSIKANNVWAHVLGSLIRTEPFIIMGASLEEADITYFLADRRDVAGRHDRPPSIIIEPAPDAATDADCAEFKMSLYKGLALNFLEEINKRFPVRPSVEEAIFDNLGDISTLQIQPAAIAEFHSDFERVPAETLIGSDGGTNFAYGHQATWLDIQNERDVAREDAAKWQEQLGKADGTATFLIEGAPGAGKTTLLKRTAWSLAQSGALCFWLRAVGRIRVDSVIAVLGPLKRKCYLFIDNFADNVNELIALRQRGDIPSVIFVGAERSYRLEHIRRVMSGDLPRVFSLGTIGHAFSSKLIQAYTNYGLAASRSADKITFPLEDELVAIACCRILNNFEPLGSIIDRSMRDAPGAIDCYIFAALAAHCYRLGVEYDVISSRFDGYQVDQQAEGDGPLPLKITEVSDVELVTPLNEAMSDSVLRRFAGNNQESMLSAFCKLAHAIRPRVNINGIVNGEPSCRIASRLFDYDEVAKPLLGMIGAGRFYDYTKNDWQWNSRYWHQIAQYKLDLAENCNNDRERKELSELAVQHARFARSIEPDHQFTMTTIGRIIFGKLRVLKGIGPTDLSEAIESLSRAITIEGKKRRTTVHPFMTLFIGLTEAIAMGAVLTTDQKSLVQLHIKNALKLFPRDYDLAERARRLNIYL